MDGEVPYLQREVATAMEGEERYTAKKYTFKHCKYNLFEMIFQSRILNWSSSNERVDWVWKI